MLQSSIRKFRASLTVRVFFITAAMLMAACLITYCFLAWATPISYDSVVGMTVVEQTQALVEQLSTVTFEESDEIINRFMQENSVVVMLLNEEGNEVNEPPPDWQQDAYADEDVDLTTSIYAATSTGVSTQLLFMGSDEPYQLVVTLLVTPVNHTVEAMQRILPYLVIVILIVSFLGALFYAWYITRPIVRLSALSQKMKELDFSCQSGEKRTDEIGVLGRNLDSLSDRLSTTLGQLRTANQKLQEDIDAEREMQRQHTEFFAAASHELKTPLTILSGQLTGMYENVGVYQDHEKYLPRSLAVVGRMEKLVGELLVVSRMDGRGKADEMVAMSQLVESQVGNVIELALLRSQEVETSIEPGVLIAGDKDLIQRAVSNLLSNAVIHSPERAKITVLLEGKKLIVRNTCVHIPADDLAHLFEPFYRVDGSRNSKTGGSGMGLYFVKMVLNRHGGSCLINNTAQGVEAILEF